MEAAFRALLSAALPGAGGRVSWGMREQGGDLPSVTIIRISGAPTYAMAGPDGHVEDRLQVDFHDRTMAGAQALASSAITALSGYRGGVFQGLFLAGRRDLTEPGATDADRTARVSLDFMVHYRS